MSKFLTIASATLALTAALAAPAHAQLLGGRGGGGFGGGLGMGGIGPIGGIGGNVGGNIGVNGAVNGAIDPVRTTTRATRSVKTVVRVPVVAVPAVPVVNTVIAVPAIAVPAIPDLAIRRTAIIESGIAPIAYSEVPVYVDRQYDVLQEDLRGTGVVVERRGQQIVLDMPSDVTFAFNKYDIQPRFYGVLNAVSRTLAKFPASYVDVDGHTDAIGSFSYNEVLSQQRAGSVADYLTARQVNGARMHVQGFGKTEPVASNATISGRAANRRVEIILTPYAA